MIKLSGKGKEDMPRRFDRLNRPGNTAPAAPADERGS